MSNSHLCGVVVHDPFHQRLEGEIVLGAEVSRLEARGVSIVRADHDLVKSPTAAGQGYVRRSFGQGVLLDSYQANGPQLFAPVGVFALAGKNRLEWCAGVVLPRGAKDLHGALRLAIAPVLASGAPPGMRTIAPVPLESLPPSEELITVKGEATVELDCGMFLPVCLSGIGRGVTVRWLAIGQRIE